MFELLSRKGASGQNKGQKKSPKISLCHVNSLKQMMHTTRSIFLCYQNSNYNNTCQELGMGAILSSMGIWDRLGSVIKSYFVDDGDTVFTRSGPRRQGDPDLNAAYEELDDFLKGNDGKDKSKTRGDEKEKAAENKRPVPEEIRQDFAELGLTPEATPEECKEAYKKLLKIHHPDRHVNHEGNMKKATEKTARVNAAYDRLEAWFRIPPGR
jgi:hypothetical protein